MATQRSKSIGTDVNWDGMAKSDGIKLQDIKSRDQRPRMA